MKEDIAAVWELGPLSPPQAVQVNRHGDRGEARRLWASAALGGYSDWPHLAQVCRIERVVWRKGQCTRDVAYAVTSLSPQEASPQRLLRLWCGHWGIENGLHWVRDVTFDEDRCQVRTRAAPQVLAACSNAVIGLLHMSGYRAIAPTLRRLAAHPCQALALVGVHLPQE